MSEHFQRHRGDAEDLSAFATSRGLPMTTERAYRAWCAYSETASAGWLIHELHGEEAERIFCALEGAEATLREQDAAFLSNEYSDVARMHERAEADGLGLTPEDVARIWADHSATEGTDWSSTRHADIDAVLNPRGTGAGREGPAF